MEICDSSIHPLAPAPDKQSWTAHSSSSDVLASSPTKVNNHPRRVVAQLNRVNRKWKITDHAVTCFNHTAGDFTVERRAFDHDSEILLGAVR